MALIAYAGDSRTMTVDNLKSIYKIVKSIDKNIWLHVDACHGFSLGCSSKLKNKIKGIELFDSISTDPHKVFCLPYVLSALLLKDPQNFDLITSSSDLITKEPFSFGQITPFVGSKPRMSLKLRFFMKNLGKKGLSKLIEYRHNIALYLGNKISKDKNFLLLNNIDINSVVFMYIGNIKKTKDINEYIKKINELNIKIYKKMLEDGIFYIHNFSIPDQGYIKKGENLNVLRFMSGNPNIKKEDIEKLINYIKNIGKYFI